MTDLSNLINHVGGEKLDSLLSSFTQGQHDQVSDTDITQRVMRREVLGHALVSFLFGAVILATTVNLVVGLCAS